MKSQTEGHGRKGLAQKTPFGLAVERLQWGAAERNTPGMPQWSIPLQASWVVLGVLGAPL